MIYRLLCVVSLCQLLSQVVVASTSINQCSPHPRLTKKECIQRSSLCSNEYSILMKWVGPAGGDGHGGCQCYSFCGYATSRKCRRDRQCSWNRDLAGVGGCISKTTGVSFPPAGVCPATSTPAPSLRPSQSPSASGTSQNFQQQARLQQTTCVGYNSVTVNCSQGYSVALSGDGNTALVGDLDVNSYYGSVDIYNRKNGSVWSLLTTLPSPTDNTANSYFGNSVSLSADGLTALVGSPYDNSRAGSATAFILDSTQGWIELGKLVPETIIGEAEVGSSVDLSADGTTACIGGPDDNDDTGATWIYKKDYAGVFVPSSSKLVGTNPETNANMGYSCALNGDCTTMISGAPNAASHYGKAIVFILDSSAGWVQQIVLTPHQPNGVENDNGPYFGISVDLDASGNVAVIAASNNNGGDGAVWVYVRTNGNTWNWQQTLGASSGIGFGDSVQINAAGTLIAVSAPFSSDANGNYPGAAILFALDASGNWYQSGNFLIPNTESETDSYDIAMSEDGQTVLIGAVGLSNGVGGAFVFVEV